MVKERMTNRIIMTTLFFFWVTVVWSQIQTTTDTILCHNRSIIIEHPTISKTNIVNYEEGCFNVINCVLDTAIITVHCGSMVNLPLTDLTDKTILSKFLLGSEIRCIRGFYYTKNRRKKFFREDNYFKYGITIAYENVDESRQGIYENIFNNIKIW